MLKSIYLIFWGSCLMLLSFGCAKKVIYPNPIPLTMEKTNAAPTDKEKALLFMNALAKQGDFLRNGLLHASFVSHDLVFGGISSAFLEKTKNAAFETVEVIRVFADPPFVFLHSKAVNNGSKVRFDILKFADNKIIEHRSNMQPLLGPTPSGHTMLDGPVTVQNLSETLQNKALAADLMEKIFIKESGGAGKYFKMGNYVQHAPEVGDGVLGLLRAIRKMKKMGISIKYLYNDQVLGEGNFVLSRSRGLKGGKAFAFYDLLRVEKGKFVEHWDVVAPIAMPEDWKTKHTDVLATQKKLWEEQAKKREKLLKK